MATAFNSDFVYRGEDPARTRRLTRERKERSMKAASNSVRAYALSPRGLGSNAAMNEAFSPIRRSNTKHGFMPDTQSARRPESVYQQRRTRQESINRCEHLRSNQQCGVACDVLIKSTCSSFCSWDWHRQTPYDAPCTRTKGCSRRCTPGCRSRLRILRCVRSHGLSHATWALRRPRPAFTAEIATDKQLNHIYRFCRPKGHYACRRLCWASRRSQGQGQRPAQVTGPPCARQGALVPGPQAARAPRRRAHWQRGEDGPLG